jgi:heterodisulfide reductase subunit A
MDVRAHGKGYEGLYERVQRKGVLYRRGIPSEIYERDGVLVVRGEDTLLGEPYELEADVIILATGLEPSDGVRELASVLGLKLDENGFFQEMTPLDPVLSTREGIFLAGCCQAPKDISDTVAHASGAAAKALALICGEKK